MIPERFFPPIASYLEASNSQYNHWFRACLARPGQNTTIDRYLVTTNLFPPLQRSCVAACIASSSPSEQGSQRVNDATTLYKAKKSPPGHHVPHRALHYHGHGGEGPGAAPPTGPRQDYAPLWPPVPGPGQGVCVPGAPDGNPAAGDRQDRLSKRAQKFRRLLRLKRHKANEFKGSKN